MPTDDIHSSSGPPKGDSQGPQVPVLSWPIFEPHPVRAVVTTRQGGVSTGPYESLNLGLHVGDDPAAVVENRRRAARTVGLELDDLVFGKQVHGYTAVEVTAGERSRGTRSLEDAVAEADALVTADPGVGLVVLVADCVPMILYDPPTHMLATVHAGWRGTVTRTVHSAIALMDRRGARGEDILAAIGPSIGRDRYQVGDDVAAAARQAFGERTSEVLEPDGHGHWLFDLLGANRLLLQDAGVRPHNIAASDVETSDDRLFSDRARRPCGRFGVLACLLESQ